MQKQLQMHKSICFPLFSLCLSFFSLCLPFYFAFVFFGLCWFAFFSHFFARLFFSSLLISLNRQWSGEHNANGVLTIKHWLWWYYRDWIWLNYITTSRINLTTSLRRHLKNVFFDVEKHPQVVSRSHGVWKHWNHDLDFFWGLDWPSRWDWAHQQMKEI